MNARFISRNIHTAAVLLLLVLVSCAVPTYFRTAPADESVPAGAVTLFLYGGNTPLKTAIMDVEGDGYAFSMTGSTHLYTVKRNLPADQARQEALGFMAGQRHRWGNILDSQGAVIGHDVRPLYNVIRYGDPDILDITYRLDGTTVHVTVALDSAVQKVYERDRYGGD